MSLAVVATGSAWGQTPGGSRGGGARGNESTHSGIASRPPAPETAAPVTLIAAVQFRLDLLEDDLRLRPEQGKAWTTYRERVLKLAEDAQRTSRSALGGDLPAPKRLDRLADIARDRLTAIEDIVDAGKALYATLTPGQQMVADRRMAVPIMALVGVEPNSANNRNDAPPKSP
ncbi:MAG: Spy/CpxP family protein refolding chaperone [Betaproteobacteria bacterium]